MLAPRWQLQEGQGSGGGQEVGGTAGVRGRRPRPGALHIGQPAQCACLLQHPLCASLRRLYAASAAAEATIAAAATPTAVPAPAPKASSAPARARAPFGAAPSTSAGTKSYVAFSTSPVLASVVSTCTMAPSPTGPGRGAAPSAPYHKCAGAGAGPSGRVAPALGAPKLRAGCRRRAPSQRAALVPGSAKPAGSRPKHAQQGPERHTAAGLSRIKTSTLHMRALGTCLKVGIEVVHRGPLLLDACPVLAGEARVGLGRAGRGGLGRAGRREGGGWCAGRPPAGGARLALQAQLWGQVRHQLQHVHSPAFDTTCWHASPPASAVHTASNGPHAPSGSHRAPLTSLPALTRTLGLGRAGARHFAASWGRERGVPSSGWKATLLRCSMGAVGWSRYCMSFGSDGGVLDGPVKAALPSSHWLPTCNTCSARHGRPVPAFRTRYQALGPLQGFDGQDGTARGTDFCRHWERPLRPSQALPLVISARPHVQVPPAGRLPLGLLRTAPRLRTPSPAAARAPCLPPTLAPRPWPRRVEGGGEGRRCSASSHGPS